MVKQCFPYGTVELEHPETGTFKVNGQRLKLYAGKGSEQEDREEVRVHPLEK